MAADDAELRAEGVEAPSKVQSLVRLVLGVVGLFVLLFLLTLVPPLEQEIPQTPVTYEAVITAAVTVVIFGLFVVIADELGDVVEARLAGPDGLVSDVGSLVQYLVVFLAFLVMYEPLFNATVPFLARNNTPWVYDLVFVAVAFLLLGVTAFYAYRTIGPVAELVARRAPLEGEATDGDDDRNERTATTADEADENDENDEATAS